MWKSNLLQPKQQLLLKTRCLNVVITPGAAGIALGIQPEKYQSPTGPKRIPPIRGSNHFLQFNEIGHKTKQNMQFSVVHIWIYKPKDVVFQQWFHHQLKQLLLRGTNSPELRAWQFLELGHHQQQNPQDYESWEIQESRYTVQIVIQWCI